MSGEIDIVSTVLQEQDNYSAMLQKHMFVRLLWALAV